jgi:hypothetical protein
VLANGYTGKIDGEYPKSFWKILFVTVLTIVVVLFLLMVMNQ